MKIYVGMIAYNASPVIEAAIKSVYDYVDEIIVVDGSAYGASTDDTAELAQSVGSKVKVVKGKFCNPDGSRDEKSQRQTYMNLMERSNGNWGILQDADEVFSRDNIERFISHIKNVNSNTKVLSHRFIHFWKDIKHTIHGGWWDLPRNVSAFRLTKDMMMTSGLAVGEKPDESITGEVIDDVICHHYGHAMKFERRRFKVQEYFKAGLFYDHSKYSGTEEEKLQQFLDEWKINEYEADLPEVKVYEGTHPESIVHLIGSYFLV